MNSSTRNFQLSSHLSNLLAILTILNCVAFIPADYLAPTLIALAYVNFYHGFLSTYISEIFTTNYFSDGNSKLINYIFASILLSILGVFFLFIIDFFFKIVGDSFYFLLIALGVVFGTSSFVCRSYLTIKGNLNFLTLVNLLDALIYIIIIVLVSTELFFLSHELLLIRLPVVSLVLILPIVISSPLFKLTAFQDFICKLKDFPLSLNLFLKSFVSNMDIVLIGNALGQGFVPIYRLLQGLKQLLTSISSALWRSRLSAVIETKKLNFHKFNKVITNNRNLIISLSLIGAFLIYTGNTILDQNLALRSYISIPIWEYTYEIILYLFLIAVPYSLIEWTRITLLLEDKIYLSTIVHIFIFLSLLIAYTFGSNLIFFISIYGALLSIIFFFYAKYIFKHLKKEKKD